MTLLLIVGGTSVSNQSSPEGIKVIFPIQLGVEYGWTFSIPVAFWFAIKAISWYGSVIKSPVRWYPLSALNSSVVLASINLTLLITHFGLSSPLTISTATL